MLARLQAEAERIAELARAAPDENCHFADTPSPFLLLHLPQAEGGAAE